MDFGIGIAASSDARELVTSACGLGFTHAGFCDTQMIAADRVDVMGA